jgi:DNA-binding NtrC family response regulator
VDVRVVAATHKDLTQAVSAGLFREDLFFRLCVIQLQLPPLRERREDIPLILERALSEPEVVAAHGHCRFSPEALSLLLGYEWPGNVRELMNVVSHVLTFAEGEEVLPEHLPPHLRGEEGGGGLPFDERQSFRHAKEQLLEGFEREYLATLLRRCEGNLSRAARESGLHRKSIERLVKKYGLDRPATPPRGRASLKG